MAKNHVTLSDNAETLAYFKRMNLVLDAVITHSSSTRKTNMDECILDYIKSLQTSFQALSWKHRMNGLVNTDYLGEISIDTTDSGFPAFQAFLELEQDYLKAQDDNTNVPHYAQKTEEALRSELLDSLITRKRINTDIQHDLCRKHYYDILKSSKLRDLFFKSNNFYTEFTVNEDENRLIILWAVYDSEQNIPNIYALDYTVSDMDEFKRTKKNFLKYIFGQSMSGLKLYTIAKDLDERFAFIHPKMLKRIHVGPLYIKTLTQHNDQIQQVLEETPEINNDWMMAWSTETLLSKGAKFKSKGIFGHQMIEEFDMDIRNHRLFEAGVTDLEQNIIMSHDAYQILSDQKGNTLNRYNSYVIDENNTVLHF